MHNLHGYEGVMTPTEVVNGWAEGTRRGLRMATASPRRIDLDISGAMALSNAMDFDQVIYSFGDGRIVDVIGLWAPDAWQGTDEHGEWMDPELTAGTASVAPEWHLMTGYSGQDGYSGPWMHQSEYIGGRMAEDILSTPGFYVAIYPTVEQGGTDDAPVFQDPDTWAVAYISENIPGSVR